MQGPRTSIVLLLVGLSTPWAIVGAVKESALGKSKELQARGLYGPALEAAREHVASHPKDPAGRSQLGSLLYHRGDWREAITECEFAIALGADYPEVMWLLIAKAQNYQGRHAQALIAYGQMGERSAFSVKLLSEVFLTEVAAEKHREAAQTAASALGKGEGEEEAKSVVRQVLAMGNE